MIRRGAPAVALLCLACADDTETLPYGEAHPPLRTPCQATAIPVWVVVGHACHDVFPDPRIEDPEFFPSERPRSSRSVTPDGRVLAEVEYDHDQQFFFPNALYRDDGNIQSVTYPEEFPGQEVPR